MKRTTQKPKHLYNPSARPRTSTRQCWIGLSVSLLFGLVLSRSRAQGVVE